MERNKLRRGRKDPDRESDLFWIARLSPQVLPDGFRVPTEVYHRPLPQGAPRMHRGFSENAEREVNQLVHVDLRVPGGRIRRHIPIHHIWRDFRKNVVERERTLIAREERE